MRQVRAGPGEVEGLGTGFVGLASVMSCCCCSLSLLSSSSSLLLVLLLLSLLNISINSIIISRFHNLWCLSFRSRTSGLREDWSAGYGLWLSTEIYGSNREKTLFHEYLQEACCVPTEISENLQKPLGVYGKM